MKGPLLFLGAGVIFFFVILIAVLTGGGSPDKPPAYNPPAFVDYTSQVPDLCHNRANELLKAPSTSTFGGDHVTGYDPTFTDVGYVDSENSFGAMIRTNYTCTAVHGSGTNFQVRVVFH